jgi:ATP-dependent exoDNAse (exonuclease V) alpha subunit
MHGYVSTSHAAQGKTVDHVILAESSVSFPAGSQEQFYVSASRGRQRCTVYTDDAESLREAIAGSSLKLAATELIENTNRDRRQRQRAMIDAAVHHTSTKQVACGR